MSIEPKLLGPDMLTAFCDDVERGADAWSIDDIRALLGHIAALDIELTVARGLNIGDRNRIHQLEADLREAMQTIETARGVIAELEKECRRLTGIIAGPGFS